MSLDVGALYEQMAPQIRNYFAGRLPPRDRHLAEDMAADVFVKLIPHADRYADDGHAVGLVWTVARNLLVDHQRAARSRATLCAFDLVQHDCPDERAIRDFAAVDSALSLDRCALTPLQRAALYERYWRGEPWKQVAVRLGTTEEALKKQHARALARLRQQLERAA